jgi:hypothetical protein
MAEEIVKGYTEEYKNILFFAWYRANCPRDIDKIIVEDEYGRKADKNTVRSWMKKENWKFRAETLDREVKKKVEDAAIHEKVEMLKRQAEYGKKLQEQGFQYFDENGIEKETTALQMIKIGVEIERNTRGLPQALEKIARLDNIALVDMANKLLSQYDEEDIQEIVEKVDIVDSEYREID